VVEDRNDRDASNRLEVKLNGATSGSIRTRRDEPFAGRTGACEVVVRYLDATGPRGRFEFFVNGRACGSSWESSGEARGWTSRTIHAVPIRPGDELRLDAEGPGVRLDCLQANWPHD
jgi:hypothetical protein